MPCNLITVPICSTCNFRTSEDDEYFCASLALRDGTGDNKDAKNARERFIRALNNPKKKGYRRSFESSTFTTSGFDRTGLFVGRRHGFQVDLVRLDRVVERIARSLFYVVNQRRLRKDYSAKSYSVDGMQDVSPASKLHLYDNIIKPLIESDGEMIGDGTFAYRYQMVKEDPDVSAWLLQFFGCSTFVVATIPESHSLLKVPRH